MKNYWRQSAVWATGLRHNVFQRARLKLTALYIGIVAVILIVFSFTLYYELAKNIQDNFDGNFSDEQAQTLAVSKITDQVQITIFVIDLVVLFVSSGLSYFLSGSTLRPIQRAMERQRQFTADASHELRTPLAVARADLEVALREKEWDQEKMQVRIKSTIEEIDKITEFTENLLILARFDNRTLPVSFQRLDLAQLVHRVVKKMEIFARNKGVLLSCADSSPAFIVGDLNALERLFANIINNAIQFTSKGGTIRVSVEQHDKNIAVNVQDTGAGIAEEDLPHVFERFYRADKARSFANGGTGLGLAIAQEIANVHKGSIHIESKIGKGTAVTITFPSVF